MEVYTMANGKFLPLGERKYLSMKDMAGHLGLGFTKVKEIMNFTIHIPKQMNQNSNYLYHNLNRTKTVPCNLIFSKSTPASTPPRSTSKATFDIY